MALRGAVLPPKVDDLQVRVTPACVCRGRGGGKHGSGSMWQPGFVEVAMVGLSVRDASQPTPVVPLPQATPGTASPTDHTRQVRPPGPTKCTRAAAS